MVTPPTPESAHDRILAAADAIIRHQGVTGLTMRGLADAASVALKTPYNVFGSKTGVLIALLDRVNTDLLNDLAVAEDQPVLIGLLETLDQIRRFYARDEHYYRGIFWEIMISDHPEAKTAAHANIIAIVTDRMQTAHAAGELTTTADPIALGGQLGLNLLATMGTWAGGQLSIADTMAHTRLMWISVLLTATEAPVRDVLQGLLSRPNE